jgi:hypothetical protein
VDIGTERSRYVGGSVSGLTGFFTGLMKGELTVSESSTQANNQVSVPVDVYSGY